MALAASRFIFFSSFFSLVFAACYFPDGTLAPNDTPCRDDTENAVCCGQGYACLSNGICQATGEELQKPGATEFVRGGCTDKTFRSSSCPLFCMDPDADNVGGGNGLGKCDNTTRDVYYCININSDAVDCEESKGVLFFAGTPSALTTIGVAATTAIDSTTTSAASTERSESSSDTTSDPTASDAAPTSEPKETSEPAISLPGSPSSTAAPTSATSSTSGNDEEEAQSPNYTAAIVGGAVGGAAVLVITGILIWWCKSRRQRKKDNEVVNTVEHQTIENSSYFGAGQYDARYKHTRSPPPPWKPSQHMGPVELSAAETPHELPGDHHHPGTSRW